MTRPSATAGVAPTSRAAGPLASLLAHGREALADHLDTSQITVGPAARPLVLSLLTERAAPLLVVTPKTADAEAVADGMAAFLGEGRVAVFPPWETLPHERLSPQAATVGRRLAVLDRLVRPDAYDEPLLAVIAPVRAVLQPMDPQLGDRAPLDLDTHWDGFDRLIEQLAELGYARVPQVETRGEFAVRGGIVDVFPTAGEHAVRLEFWGDDVESLRSFTVGDQRSTGEVERVRVDPARELVLNDVLRERARATARLMPSLADKLELLAEGVMFEGVESLVTLVHLRTKLLTDFLPAGAGLVIVDPLLATDRANKLREEAEVLLEVAWETAAGHRPEDVGFADPADLRVGLGDRVWELGPFGQDGVPAMPWDSFRGDVEALALHVRTLLRADDPPRIVVTTNGHGPAQRLTEVLREQSVPTDLVEALSIDGPPGRVEVVPSLLRDGTYAPQLGLALLGEWDVFGPRRSGRAGRRLGTKKSAAETVLNLEVGDHIVHRTHGVGIYKGMVAREIRKPNGEKATRDYVLLEYAKGDVLYVPNDQVDAIARYAGGDMPSVMRLGGAEWERAKTRVRKAVRDIAAELIRLYAARMHSPGIAFAPDGAWQRELEDSFEHIETPDQLTVIDEIKRDMEAPLPMDRLLAGDVGFGKTEVAVRAAAKAMFDGHQVAVLVPTTLLAQQHYETFRERFVGFPVQVRVLSRFQSPKERKEVIEGLEAGTIELVVGTHALFSKAVKFKDLGLVVVDEEQRFGVTHKEKLKQMKTSVDVLTMSATPIPRTLEMAVSGIRDMSVIETPPEHRQPIVTIVAPYDEAQVALAIRRELLREGQIFYVHNQVQTIHNAAAHIKELVPNARIGIAHGQMNEHALERIMVGFWENEFDVLVCTTIVESGLDVPNANTLIIERADLLGLSQLHQLRGRVGRSNERGYAYFFHPPDSSMTETAYERLTTISENSRLGSGLSIAMRDLEIRGAGNVVGAEQSGQVAAVGFDMYAQLLREEVASLSGNPVEPDVEIKIDLPVDAHLPATYVEDERQRLDLYKRLAAVRDAAGVKGVRAELADRFGPLPEPAERLVTLAALKGALRRWGIRELSLNAKQQLRAYPITLGDSQQVRLERRYRGATWSEGTEVLVVPMPREGVDDVVAWVAGVLRDLLSPPKRAWRRAT